MAFRLADCVCVCVCVFRGGGEKLRDFLSYIAKL